MRKAIIIILALASVAGCSTKSDQTKDVLVGINKGPDAAYRLGRISGILAYQTIIERQDRDYKPDEIMALADSISGFYNKK